MSTPGMKTAAAIIAFRFANGVDQTSADGRTQHGQARREGRGVVAERAGDARRDRLDRESLPRRDADEVRRRARTAPTRSSVTATIGTPAREAAAQRSSSGAPTQMSAASPSTRLLDDGDGVAARAQLAGEQRHELARARDPERAWVADAAPQLPRGRRAPRAA